jgi:methyl-accepting chemotaxis protein
MVEAYLEASLLNRFPESLPERRKRLARLKNEFNEGQAYWSAQDIEPPLKALLAGNAREPALRFWTLLDEDFLPAIASGDAKRADDAFRLLPDAYAEHKKWIEETLRHARSRNEHLKRYAASAVSSGEYWYLLLSALVMLLIGASITALLRGLVQPFSRMKTAICSLAEGNDRVDIPFLSRKDEIGIAARSLEILRQRSNEFLSLKNSVHALEKKDAEREKAVREQARELRQAIDGIKEKLRDLVGKASATVPSIKIIEPAGSTASHLQSSYRDHAAAAAAISKALMDEWIARISEVTQSIKAAAEEQASLADAIDRNTAARASTEKGRLIQGETPSAETPASLNRICRDLSEAMDRILCADSISPPEIPSASQDMSLMITLIRDSGATETFVEEITPHKIRIKPIDGLIAEEQLSVDLGFGPLSARVAAVCEDHADLTLANQADGIYLGK